MDSRLEKAIVEAFDANGPLCRQIEGFKRRDSQLQFAQAVGQAIQTQGVAVVEAGTGTGKTFAYLVPAILSRSKTIVSTASKTLQDQLFEKMSVEFVQRLPSMPMWLCLKAGETISAKNV